MSRQFEIDDEVEYTPPGGDAAEFWRVHAEYWRERGNVDRAQECDDQARRGTK